MISSASWVTTHANTLSVMSLAWTRYGSSSGLPVVSLSCCGIYAFNRVFMQELLQMVPQPVVAVLFLFPVTKESEAAKEAGIPIGSPTTEY